jgi:Leucine-rich repeat (LRR) protein
MSASSSASGASVAPNFPSSANARTYLQEAQPHKRSRSEEEKSPDALALRELDLPKKVHQYFTKLSRRENGLANVRSSLTIDCHIGDKAVKIVELTHPLLRRLVFFNVRLTEEGVIRITNMKRGLRELNLKYNPLTSRAVTAIAGLEMLETLDVGYCQLNEADAEMIAKMKSLTKLGYQINGLGKNGAEALANTQLQDLDISGCRFSTPGVLQTFLRSRSLQTFSACSRVIDEEELLDFAKKTGIGTLLFDELANRDRRYVSPQILVELAKNSAVTSISFGANQVSDLALRALRDSTRLLTLSLDRCSMQGRGSAFVLPSVDGEYLNDQDIEILSGNGTLRSLRVYNNAITASGVQRGIANIVSLTSVDVGRNKIGDEGVFSLLTLPNLTDLNCQECGVQELGGKALGRSTLASLDASQNSLGSEAIQTFASNTTITHLTINEVVGMDAIAARALSRNLNIIALQCSQREMSRAILRILQGIAPRNQRLKRNWELVVIGLASDRANAQSPITGSILGIIHDCIKPFLEQFSE